MRLLVGENICKTNRELLDDIKSDMEGIRLMRNEAASETLKNYLGRKNERTGNCLPSYIDNGNEGKVFVCGKCGEKQNIFATERTGFVEELDFVCCKCGERNTISYY